MQQFQMARAQADLELLWAKLTGRSAELLPFEEVQKLLHAVQARRRVRKEIPLDAIVGSVGRYRDFTRRFLPRRSSDGPRWANVRLIASSPTGLPPISVYQVGDAYFVQDGNHRISVARQLGATHILADVTELDANLPLAPEDDLDALIIKAEYAEFLEYTGLDRLRPQHELTVTAPGQYRLLMEMIDIHHYYMSREQGHKIPYDDAVTDWYDNVYLPAVALIRERGMLRGFPGRTETDLFAWISEHRAEISRELGWPIDTEAAALDLVRRYGWQPESLAARLGERLLDATVPEALGPSPRPGEWRREWLPTHRSSRLFQDVLVAIDGGERGWNAFQQAALLAQRDRGELHGLHLVEQEADRYGPQVAALREEFDRRAQVLGLGADLRVELMKERPYPRARAILERARWADVLVAPVKKVPTARSLSRLNSGMGVLIRRCPRPILAVPGPATKMQHGMLAFDGSRKAREALYVAVYLAARWKIKLTIASVMEPGRVTDETLGVAYEYATRRGVQPDALRLEGPVVQRLQAAVQRQGCDFLIAGGYGHTPVLEVVLGSTVDALLRSCG
ncbi:MAG: universal stress protein, partial [Caldilineae bacterium]